MILLVDSGSTKAAWAFIDANGQEIGPIYTIGINPFQHSQEDIVSIINDESALSNRAAETTDIHFYGASCSSEERCTHVAQALGQVFTNANIIVDHDLKAAAIACNWDRKGVVCILGTGSSVCYYDGVDCTQLTPALGYVLGDECSGTAMGKAVLRSYLYGRMPTHIQAAFEENYPDLHKDKVLDRVYAQANPKPYIASFSRFLGDYHEDPFTIEIIKNEFKKLSSMHLLNYSKLYPNSPISFVGSMAYQFQDVLSKECALIGFTKGSFVRKPLLELVKYYKAKILV